MKGQKGFLLGLAIDPSIKESKIGKSLQKAGIDHIWNTHKQQVDGKEYIVLGLYTQSLEKHKSLRIRNMVQRLTRDGFINPTLKRGNKRANLLNSINTDYNNAGYPITLLSQQDFLFVMCMDDISRAGKLVGNDLEERIPSNKFELLLLNKGEVI